MAASQVLGAVAPVGAHLRAAATHPAMQLGAAQSEIGEAGTELADTRMPSQIIAAELMGRTMGRSGRVHVFREGHADTATASNTSNVFSIVIDFPVPARH